MQAGPQLIEKPIIHETASPEEIADLVDLYFEDNDAYAGRFFPQTCRHKSPEFHGRIDRALWSNRRKIAIKVFRGGAKTTRVRLYLSKRIAYGISRTILYISKSEGAALATLDWLKNHVEKQTDWAKFYGIQKGNTWSNEKAEFYNSVLGITITVVSVGIHGQIRGLNFDDFRPDLIICDDIEDEKTVNTKEQIKKHSDLLHGTVLRSLASPVDNPDAKIVIIQTPLDIGDAIEEAFKAKGDDPLSDWFCIEASCFTLNEEGQVESSWPSLLPLSFLLSEKQSAIKANKLSVWMREMEVTVVSPETCFFLDAWLQKHDVLPEGPWKTIVIWVDPASSDSKSADFQAVTATGLIGGHAWLLFYKLAKGRDIDQSIEDIFDAWSLAAKMTRGQGTLIKLGIEQVGYQKQLKRAMEKAMKARNKYIYIEDVKDPRKAKEDVINQAINPVASNLAYHCLNSHTDFISDFVKYPQVSHDDLIESAARGLDMLDLTGKGDDISFGSVERSMASPTIIHRSANRLIRSGGLRLPMAYAPDRNYE